MAGLMSRFFEIIGLGDPVDDEEEVIVQAEESVLEMPQPSMQQQNSARSNVVPLRQAAQAAPASTQPAVVAQSKPGPINQTPLAVASHAYADRTRVISVYPQRSNDLLQIISMMRENCIIAVSFEGINPDVKASWLYYLSGASVALDGTLDPISHNTYLLAPASVDYTSHQKQILLKRDSEERGREDRFSDREDR